MCVLVLVCVLVCMCVYHHDLCAYGKEGLICYPLFLGFVYKHMCLRKYV